MITKTIKSKYIITGGKRIDGKFFLNKDAFLSLKMRENEEKCSQLSEFTHIFNPQVFKRQFCQDTDRAVGYFQSSDVPVVFEESRVFINKAQAKKVNALVKENQILITGFGSIGNVRLVSNLQDGVAYANNTCRVEAYKNERYGFIYAFIASKYGKAQLNNNSSGSVVRYIEAPGIKRTLIPLFPSEKQQEIHDLIIESAKLRVESNALLKDVDRKLHMTVGLAFLKREDYNYFGTRSMRKASCFIKKSGLIDSTTINAFNHSFLIDKLVDRIKLNNHTLPLSKVLDEKQIFSTGSFPRVEVKSNNGIMLINQSDIFDTIIQGKKISKRKVKTDNLVHYGEVLIAGVGTLGENETFCRAIFANEDIQGQLVSGEFIRMNTNAEIPSGYLYAWLNTDYGFRLIRSTQSGTKLCRPIPRLLLKLPVPILDKNIMLEIHNMVTKAHTLRYQANQKELQAIQLVENEIEQWQH